jgi:hypothetical protein
MTEAKTQAKGKWFPCGCREDVKSKTLVRVCPIGVAEKVEIGSSTSKAEHLKEHLKAKE